MKKSPKKQESVEDVEPAVAKTVSSLLGRRVETRGNRIIIFSDTMQPSTYIMRRMPRV